VWRTRLGYVTGSRNEDGDRINHSFPTPRIIIIPRDPVPGSPARSFSLSLSPSLSLFPLALRLFRFRLLGRRRDNEFISPGSFRLSRNFSAAPLPSAPPLSLSLFVSPFFSSLAARSLVRRAAGRSGRAFRECYSACNAGREKGETLER